MKKNPVLATVLLTAVLAVFFTLAEVHTEVHAYDGFEGRPIINNLSNPTGNTLHQKEFTIGLGSIGFGITDNVQVGTNILLFALQVYNADLKVNFVKTPATAIAAGFGVDHFEGNVDGEEERFTSLSPFLALTRQVHETTNLHIGGTYSHFDSEAEVEDVEVEALFSGSTLFTGLEYSLSNRTKFLAEADYDMTFDGFRVGGGVLFGWDTFRIKLGVKYYNPEGDEESFTFPVIGLWWRFMG